MPETLSAANIIDTNRLHNSLILVVDDVEINRKMLSHSLRAHGYTNIITAGDGAEALTLTREKTPDLVVLDLMMPGMDGFAYLEALQQTNMWKNMPILVQTALSEIEKKLRAFELGAADYICKPIEPDELSARAHVHLARKILTEDLCEYKQRVTEELHAARLMQERLMPAASHLQMCERVYDMKIASHYATSSDLGGDCWGVRALSDTRLAIYTYDFSGHGISSAMNVFRMHTIMQEFMHTGGDPGSFLATLNHHLFQLLERGKFATMFYGILDMDANCLLYASAATPPALLLPHGQPEPMLLQGRGFPLGVLAHATYETKYTPFMRGDLLTFYSDGLVENIPQHTNPFHDEMLKKAIGKAAKSTQKNLAQSAIDHLFDACNARHASPSDGITITSYWRLPALG